MTASKTPACRLCGADASRQSVRAPHVFGGSETHKFWECAACGGIYLFPFLTQEEEQRFYAKEFEKFMATRSGAERDWSDAERHIATNQDQLKRRWRFLAPHFAAGKSVLEIGCSSGFMLDAFRAAGMTCVGVEPSNVFIDYLRNKDVAVFTSLDELEAGAPRQFDLITHFFVLEHIADPYAFFRRQMALLKPGGVIVAEVPSATDPLTSLYSIPAFERFYWSIAHHYYYTPRSLSAVLDKLGLRYRLLPEQRYDLSNHIVWMTEGKPGGQNRFKEVFTPALVDKYREDLKTAWQCDTIILEVFRDSAQAV